MKLYFVLLIKSHLLSYPCPIIINYLWNIGFLLGITIILQIITGIFLGLHYTSDLNSAYFSIFQIIREIYYGWCLPFGQMSFWDATVITNLLSPFPSLIEFVCGGYYVYNPTLKRFFVFHFLFPRLGFYVTNHQLTLDL